MTDKPWNYTDPLVRSVRAGPNTPHRKTLPPDDVACVHCEEAIWLRVDRTATAKANAMKGMTDKPAWRCYCRALHRLTYDDFAGLPAPECWIFDCTVQHKQALPAAGGAPAVEGPGKKDYLPPEEDESEAADNG